MTKKISILTFLVVLPNLLAYTYDKLFRFSGNWLEDYQNYFKFGLLVISILGAMWLITISFKEKKYFWLAAGIISLIFLAACLFMGLVVTNMSIGF